METIARQAGRALWEKFNESERCLVRFGMFPRAPMETAEKTLLGLAAKLDLPATRVDVARWLACGVMEACNQLGPGMVV